MSTRLTVVCNCIYKYTRLDRYQHSGSTVVQIHLIIWNLKSTQMAQRHYLNILLQWLFVHHLTVNFKQTKKSCWHLVIKVYSLYRSYDTLYLNINFVSNVTIDGSYGLLGLWNYCLHNLHFSRGSWHNFLIRNTFTLERENK